MLVNPLRVFSGQSAYAKTEAAVKKMIPHLERMMGHRYDTQQQALQDLPVFIDHLKDGLYPDRGEVRQIIQRELMDNLGQIEKYLLDRHPIIEQVYMIQVVTAVAPYMGMEIQEAVAKMLYRLLQVVNDFDLVAVIMNGLRRAKDVNVLVMAFNHLGVSAQAKEVFEKAIIQPTFSSQLLHDVSNRDLRKSVITLLFRRIADNAVSRQCRVASAKVLSQAMGVITGQPRQDLEDEAWLFVDMLYQFGGEILQDKELLGEIRKLYFANPVIREVLFDVGKHSEYNWRMDITQFISESFTEWLLSGAKNQADATTTIYRELMALAVKLSKNNNDFIVQTINVCQQTYRQKFGAKLLPQDLAAQSRNFVTLRDFFINELVKGVGYSRWSEINASLTPL